MKLSDVVRFQKTLALAASAANAFEVEAAELAARRLVEACNIDPTRVPNISLYSRTNFANNALLQKLREEYRALHPDRRKPKAKPVKMAVNTKPKAKPVEPTGPTIPFSLNGYRKHAAKSGGEPSSDRSRDRHSPGYMRDYMRRRRARRQTPPR